MFVLAAWSVLKDQGKHAVERGASWELVAMELSVWLMSRLDQVTAIIDILQEHVFQQV